MLEHRPIDLSADRDLILEFRCLGNYQSDSPWTRPARFADYQAKWLNTSEPARFIEFVSQALNDPRTIAEIWEENDKAAGFMLVVFSEIEGYDSTVAEVHDVEVALEHQRRGIGTLMIQHAENLARERGAKLLRSESSVENPASQALHEKLGFSIHRFLYEKRLEK